MKYAVLLGLLGLAQIALAFSVGGWGAWLLAWSGLSWFLTGIAYAFGGLGHNVFGKRRDGRIVWWRVLPTLPYLAVTWLLWWLQRHLSREPAHHEIAPGLWLGRRCSGKKLSPQIALVVDLTAEFGEPARVRTGRDYLWVPSLDASHPPLDAFADAVRTIAGTIKEEKAVYIHCAKGHGRSAMLMAAALMATGNAASLQEAEDKIRRARPGVKINTVQRRMLTQWAESGGRIYG